jgi:hypothetical protein
MSKATFLFAVFLLVCLFLQSCYDIDNNRRVLVTGNLVDENGDPVSGITVESRGSNTVLGFHTSEENGDFSFTSIESNASDFSIYINPEIAQDTLYASSTYINQENFSESPVDNHKRSQNLYDLGNVTLRQIGFLEIAVNRTSGTLDTLNYTINFSETSCQNYFGEEQIDTLRSLCFIKVERGGSILPESEDLKIYHKTLKNSSAIFTYRINNGKKEQVIIPIDQYNTRYVFEF